MKTLGIKPVDGIVNPTVLDDAIIPVSINTSSLGSLVLSLIDNSEGLLCIAVDVASRRVRAVAAVADEETDAVALVRDHDDAVAFLAFTKVDATKRTSAWTTGLTAFAIGAGGANAFQDVIKPVQPELSSGSLVGAFEDATLDDTNALFGFPVVITLDQGNGTVTVTKFAATSDGKNSAAAAVDLIAATIAYDQIPSVTSASVREPLG